MYSDMDDEIQNNGKDEHGFFCPVRPDEHRHYDTGIDLGLEGKYGTEVDLSHYQMGEEEYTQLMQSLNLRQSEVCIHIMQWIQTKTEAMHIFIEGGAGVGKTRAAKAICESMNRFYKAQPGTNPDQLHSIVLAPTGMAAYQVKGNTIHTGLHISINQEKLTSLGSSELNTLCSKYLGSKQCIMMNINGRKKTME